MNFFLPRNHKPAIYRHITPWRYHHYRMAAARPTYEQNSFGDFFVQVVVCKGFHIQLNLFHILKKVCLYPFTPRGVITMHFMLKGHIHCLLRGFGEVWLTEGLYHLFYVPGGVRHKAWFEKGDYLSFHIDLSRQYLKRLAAKYAELQEVADKTAHHSAKGVQQHEARITPRIRGIIKEIRRCPEEEPDKSWYLDIRIRELLLLYVQDMPHKKGALPQRVKRLEEMKAYILSHLDQVHTIALLAKRVKMSESTFRRQFTNHFGQPLRSFLFHARMEAAMDILLHSDMPVGNIADAVGYHDFSNFSRAFKKYFGHPPGHFRGH